MNLEQRNRIMQKIRQLEGLLFWAKAYGEGAEDDRITRELANLVELVQ